MNNCGAWGQECSIVNGIGYLASSFYVNDSSRFTQKLLDFNRYLNFIIKNNSPIMPFLNTATDSLHNVENSTTSSMDRTLKPNAENILFGN